MNATEFRHGTHALWRASDACRGARFSAAAALFAAGSPPPPPPPPAADVPPAPRYEFGTHARAIHQAANRSGLFRSPAAFSVVPDTLQSCAPFMSFQPQQPFQPQPVFRRMIFPAAPKLGVSDQTGRLLLRAATTYTAFEDGEGGETAVFGRLFLTGSTTATKLGTTAITGRILLRATVHGEDTAVPEYDYQGVLRLLGSTTATKLGQWNEHGRLPPFTRRTTGSARRRRQN